MKKINVLFIIVATIFLSNGILLGQQDGALDLSFDTDGKILTDFGPYDDVINSLALQSDGKIVVAGVSGYSNSGSMYDFALARYNMDGSLDNTFGANGKLTISFGSYSRAFSLAIQNDGKMVIAGDFSFGGNLEFALARCNADGTLDNNFGTNGKITTNLGFSYNYASSLALQSNGQIVVAGQVSTGTNTLIALARYNTDGSLDNNFGTSGMTTTDISAYEDRVNSIAIQTDGKIVLAGYSYMSYHQRYSWTLVRYNSDGTLDSLFGSDGIVIDINSSPDYKLHSIALQSDGKIIVAGEVSNGLNSLFAIARFENIYGSLDPSFGINGRLNVDFSPGTNRFDRANSITVQPDDKIIVGGYADNGTNFDFALIRSNKDGILDNSFGTGGMLKTEFVGLGNAVIKSVAVQTDGKIVVAGDVLSGLYSQFALARYTTSLTLGNIDFPQKNNICVYPTPLQNNVILVYTLMQDEVLSIEVYDLFGRLIKSLLTMEVRSKGIHKETVNLGQSLVPGNYILIITNGRETRSIQVTKQ